MPDDLPLFLICLGIGALTGLVLALILQFGFPRLKAPLAAFSRSLHCRWWNFAGFAIVFAAFAVLEIKAHSWSFAACFVILTVSELTMMIRLLWQRHASGEIEEFPHNYVIWWVVAGGVLAIVGFVAGLLVGLVEINRVPPEQKPFFAQSATQLEKTWLMYLLYDHRLVAAVWCDIDFSVPGSSSSGGTGDAKVCKPPFGYFNSIRSADGRSVEWCVQTREDKVLAVEINGKEYRLENGDLFLVRTRRDGAPVTQVKANLTGKEPDRALWNRLADENPQIKEFIAAARAGK